MNNPATVELLGATYDAPKPRGDASENCHPLADILPLAKAVGSEFLTLIIALLCGFGVVGAFHLFCGQ